MPLATFKCYRCIHCCFFTVPTEYPIILEEEKDKLIKYARKYGKELEFRRAGKGIYVWVINGYCPFYDIKSRKCLIHNDKPLSCSMFPLLLNIKNGEVSVSLLCDWVAANLSTNKVGDPRRVFPQELDKVIKLFRAVHRRIS